VVYRHDERTHFETLRARLRRRLGVTEVAVDRGVGVWFGLREALGRDEAVMLQCDRVMPGQRGVPVAFMGGHILMPTGPEKLAAAAGAPVVPIFVTRRPDGRVRIRIGEPLAATEPLSSGDTPGPMLLRLAAALEEQVRATPEQWLRLDPVWCEDAPPNPAEAAA
jgi:KDO2-lipid IV(A) lauroyltransferase